MTDWALAQQKLELADPASPLGQAQAAAMKASMEGPADGSAFRAVEAAKAHSGVTLNMTYEVGLQALDPRNFSGPMWEQLTGMKSNVVELSNPDQYSKAVAEHIAGSGAYDVLDISPAWTPSLADGGVIAPLDDYIAKYMNMADLEDYHPLYKALPTYKGKIWGFFDDGDMFALYYRKDIFEDPKMMEAYQAKFNAKLGAAEDLGGICPDRPVHHRPDGAERLWRRPFPQGGQSRQPVRLPAAVPRQRRKTVRR